MMGAEQQKFKVGDRVRRVVGAKIDGMEVGDVGTVSACSAIGEWIGITEFPAGNGDVTPFSAYNFELVPVWQPKVGDRVVWREPFASPFYTKGKTYEIKSSRNGYLFLTDDNRNAESGNHQWGVSEISSHFDLAPTTLTISAGKFYKTRDGRKVGPMVSSIGCYLDDKQYPWTVNHHVAGITFGKAWRSDGTFDVAKGHENVADLIAEWVDEPATVANDNAAPAKFKVGDRVLSKELGPTKGLFGAIIKDDNSEVPYLVRFEAFDDGHGDGDNEWWIRAEEVSSSNIPSPTAIVALIEDGQPKPNTRPYVHTTEEAAKREADRLAGAHKGQQFGVYVLTTTSQEAKPIYEHEWQRLAAKGEKIKAIKSIREIAGLTLRGAKSAVEAFEEYIAAA